MLADAIYTLLKNDAAIVAMVNKLADGSTGQARIYPPPTPDATLPEGRLPLISFFMVSDLRDHTLTEPTNLSRPRIQIDIWAKFSGDIRKLSKLIRVALDGFHGPVVGVGYDGTQFTSMLAGVLLENRQELYESATKTQHGILDFYVWNDEAQET